MREPLFAAWVVVLSHNVSLIRHTRAEIRRALTHYHWPTLYTATFFMAVNVYYEGLPYGL